MFPFFLTCRILLFASFSFSLFVRCYFLRFFFAFSLCPSFSLSAPAHLLTFKFDNEYTNNTSSNGDEDNNCDADNVIAIMVVIILLAIKLEIVHLNQSPGSWPKFRRRQVILKGEDVLKTTYPFKLVCWRYFSCNNPKLDNKEKGKERKKKKRNGHYLFFWVRLSFLDSSRIYL